MKREQAKELIIVTAGSTYLDIDAYACCVAMAELLCLKGEHAIAYSSAPTNYSVCRSLVGQAQLLRDIPADARAENVRYVVVDVSDPEYIKGALALDQVVAVYDHHVGYEEYWKERIGEGAQIEFIGAAATLIYREWKKAGLQEQISRSAAMLLIAAILDNTLNLTSANTTQEDVDAFDELCHRHSIGREWCEAYFSEVQGAVETDLENAIFNDIKIVRDNDVLPPRVAQLCVWDASAILARSTEMRGWFARETGAWMINIIDIKHRCSYFVCDDAHAQQRIEKVFNIEFKESVARSSVSYLRKEIIKKTRCNH